MLEHNYCKLFFPIPNWGGNNFYMEGYEFDSENPTKEEFLKRVNEKIYLLETVVEDKVNGLINSYTFDCFIYKLAREKEVKRLAQYINEWFIDNKSYGVVLTPYGPRKIYKRTISKTGKV
jgi:hypothetical protein